MLKCANVNVKKKNSCQLELEQLLGIKSKSYCAVLFQIRSDVENRKVTTAGLQTERKQFIALT